MNFSNQKKIYELSKAIETFCFLRKELDPEECDLVREAAKEIQEILGDWKIVSIDKTLDNVISKIEPHLQSKNTLIKRKQFRFKVYAKPAISYEILFNIMQQLSSSSMINIHMITESKDPLIVVLVFEGTPLRKPDVTHIKKLCEENHWTLTFTFVQKINLATMRLRIIG